MIDRGTDLGTGGTIGQDAVMRPTSMIHLGQSWLMQQMGPDAGNLDREVGSTSIIRGIS